MLSPRLWLAPVALFCLQSTPVSFSTDSAGKIRLSFGGGIGSYEERITSCSGEVLDSRDVPFQQVGGQADVWASPKVRFTGYGGAMFSGSDSDALSDFSAPYEGGYGGFLLAGEWRVVGVGAGMGVLPALEAYGDSPFVLPTAYLRLGNLEEVHFRLDLGGPPGAGAPPQLSRIGVGFGQGHERKVGGFLGMGFSPFPRDDYSLGLVGDLLVPVSASLDLGGTGAIRSGTEGGLGYNIGLMLRMHLGGPPR
jgi:hypothetical protein